MERTTHIVNPRRSYDSRRRRDQALRNRAAVLETAERLFLTQGYAMTTVASIAEGADVSVETVYKAFGGKAGLVKAIWEQGLGGIGETPAPQRSDEMQQLETDPRKIIENWGTFTTEVGPRAAPILLLIRTAAATDSQMAALLQETDDARLARMEHNARHLYERGHLREGVTLEYARDVLWTYSSPELYDLLVLRQRWPLGRYGRFVAGGMIAALLPQPGGAGTTTATPL